MKPGAVWNRECSPNKSLSARTQDLRSDPMFFTFAGDSRQGFRGCVEVLALHHVHRGNLRTFESERARKRTEALSARVTLTIWDT